MRDSRQMDRSRNRLKTIKILKNIWKRFYELRHDNKYRKKVMICREGIKASKKYHSHNDYVEFSLKLAAILTVWGGGPHREKHIEQAIDICNILKADEEIEDLEIKARVYKWLGAAYCEKLDDNNKNISKKALTCYSQAQMFYRNIGDSYNAACISMLKAEVYKKLAEYNDPVQLDFAIKHLKEALKIYSRLGHKKEIADAHFILWTSYMYRQSGRKNTNIELAIHHYEKALLFYSKKRNQYVWSIIHEGLAMAFNKRIKGDKRVNSKTALNHYKKALIGFTNLKLTKAINDVSNAIEIIGLKLQERNKRKLRRG